ncbi:MAG: hypothetical protein M3417_04895 [Actinomycetota bacterium]|nr:hypothetical protein [Actinomycetota bacterium]
MAREPTVQRSFRLKSRTLELLGERAEQTSESRNALAERLIDEGLRMDRHPLISFRTGGSGQRRPALVGTRLDVWQLINLLRDENGDVAVTAESMGVSGHMVQAAIDYYADFRDEIDAYAAAEETSSREAHERWERAQRVLG